MWQNVLIIGVVAVFVLVLLYRVRPSFGFRQVKAISQGVIDARAKLGAAQTPREKAQALCEIGDAFAHTKGGRGAAMGQYLRALKVDPSWPHPIELLKDLLFKDRPLVLERTMWRRLSMVDWRTGNQEVALSCASVLADLYKNRVKDRSRAIVMKRLAEEIERCVKDRSQASQ